MEAGDLLHRPAVLIPILVPVDIGLEAMQSPLKVPGQKSSVVNGVVEFQRLKQKCDKELHWKNVATDLRLIGTPVQIGAKGSGRNKLHEVGIWQVSETGVRVRTAADLQKGAGDVVVPGLSQHGFQDRGIRQS